MKYPLLQGEKWEREKGVLKSSQGLVLFIGFEELTLFCQSLFPGHSTVQ